MKILVTGATGFTGKRVLPLLKGKGHVRCFVRKGSDSGGIKDLGDETVYGDLGDPNSLRKAMDGRDTLINIVSLGFGHAPGIIRTAEEAGIKRAVFISTTSLFTRLNAGAKNIRQKAEDHIRSSSLDWTILRPTMIYGAPDDRNMIRLIRVIDKWPCIPVFGSGEYLQQPVYVDDVAEAIITVLDNKNTVHREFNISGKDAYTYNEIIDLTSTAIGKNIIKIRIPYKISVGLAKIYEKITKNTIITSEQIMRLNENKDFEHSLAREVFGFSPISFQEGIAKEVELYRNEI